VAEDKFEILKDGLRRFNESRRTSELFADDIVWDFSGFRGWIEDKEYVGIDAFQAQMDRWMGAFETWEFDVTEMHDAGGDDVLVIGVQRGVVKGSGAVVEMPFCQIFTRTDGMLTRIRIFADNDDAYAAAGVERPA
jgi:ketosteroid isomerase-like protein